MLVTRQEMDERARRRTMQDHAAAHHYPPVPARSTDAVVNWLNDTRQEIRNLRDELDELRADMDSPDDNTSLGSRLDEIEARLDGLS